MKETIKPPKSRPQEPFAKRINGIEKRAVQIEKERAEKEKFINLDDYFKKGDQEEQQSSSLIKNEPSSTDVTQALEKRVSLNPIESLVRKPSILAPKPQPQKVTQSFEKR